MTWMTVEVPGAAMLVEDAGRFGFGHLGVGRAGPMDRAAHALANRLVGNLPDAAALEIVFGGSRIRFDSDVWIAVTGAWGQVSARSGAGPGPGPVTIEANRPALVPAGAVVEIGAASHGIRYYLAVRGGIDVPAVLGSRSWDSLARLGPAPLATNDRIAIGAAPGTPVPPHDFVPLSPPGASVISLDIRPGPRADWFTEAAWQSLLATEWRMSPRSDRAGIRLDGPALDRVRTGELPSEGMIRGAIQVSPDGSPTVLAADHPLTGGYPVIAVVTDATVDRLAQTRPGQSVRLVLASGQA